MATVDLRSVMESVDATRHFPLIAGIAVVWAAMYWMCWFACGVWRFPDRVVAGGKYDEPNCTTEPL